MMEKSKVERLRKLSLREELQLQTLTKEYIELIEQALFELECISDYQSEIDRLKSENERIKQDRELIKARCTIKAGEYFDKGSYDCLKITTTLDDTPINKYQEEIEKLKSETITPIYEEEEKYLRENADFEEVLGRYMRVSRLSDKKNKEIKKLTDDCRKLADRCNEHARRIKELEHELSEKQDFEFPDTPIACAEWLINAEYKYKMSDFEKKLCKAFGNNEDSDYHTIKMYDTDDLKQIAEHLLVYCNHQEQYIPDEHGCLCPSIPKFEKGGKLSE